MPMRHSGLYIIVWTISLDKTNSSVLMDKTMFLMTGKPHTIFQLFTLEIYHNVITGYSRMIHTVLILYIKFIDYNFAIIFKEWVW